MRQSHSQELLRAFRVIRGGSANERSPGSAVAHGGPQHQIAVGALDLDEEAAAPQRCRQAVEPVLVAAGDPRVQIGESWGWCLPLEVASRGIVGTHLREDNGVAARRSDAASAVGELERLPANPAAVR